MKKTYIMPKAIEIPVCNEYLLTAVSDPNAEVDNAASDNYQEVTPPGGSNGTAPEEQKGVFFDWDD